jgi:hypothetical protein
MKIKILIAALLLTTVFSACHNDKADEKAKQDEVIKVHNEVMGISDKVVTNKMALDTLIKKNAADTAKTTKATTLVKQLTVADDAMEKWMHEFNPDYTGKSHAEIMTYLNDQHVQIKHIDSLIKSAIDQSNTFLKAQ